MRHRLSRCAYYLAADPVRRTAEWAGLPVLHSFLVLDKIGWYCPAALGALTILGRWCCVFLLVLDKVGTTQQSGGLDHFSKMGGGLGARSFSFCDVLGKSNRHEWCNK